MNKGPNLTGRLSRDEPKTVKAEVEHWLKSIGYAKRSYAIEKT